MIGLKLIWIASDRDSLIYPVCWWEWSFPESRYLINYYLCLRKMMWLLLYFLITCLICYTHIKYYFWQYRARPFPRLWFTDDSLESISHPTLHSVFIWFDRDFNYPSQCTRSFHLLPAPPNLCPIIVRLHLCKSVTGDCLGSQNVRNVFLIFNHSNTVQSVGS